MKRRVVVIVRYLAVDYLTSYEHMGRCRVSCVWGCTCAQRVLDAHDAAEHASLRKVAYVAVSDVRRCAVELRVEDATSSGEHKWKLVRLSIGFMSAADLQ